MGNSAATMRAVIPNATTPGPDCQTIFRIGGTLRSAERRSCQLLQNFSFCAIWPSPDLSPACENRASWDIPGPLEMPGYRQNCRRGGSNQRCRKPAQRFDEEDVCAGQRDYPRADEALIIDKHAAAQSGLKLRRSS